MGQQKDQIMVLLWTPNQKSDLFIWLQSFPNLNYVFVIAPWQQAARHQLSSEF